MGDMEMQQGNATPNLSSAPLAHLDGRGWC